MHILNPNDTVYALLIPIHYRFLEMRLIISFFQFQRFFSPLICVIYFAHVNTRAMTATMEYFADM